MTIQPTPDALAAVLVAAGDPIAMATAGWVGPASARDIFGRLSERYPGHTMRLISIASGMEYGFVPDGEFE